MTIKLDAVIGNLESKCNYKKAVQQVELFEKMGVIKDIESRKKRIEKFNPEFMLAKAEVGGIMSGGMESLGIYSVEMTPISIYEKLLQNNVLPERKEELETKLQKERYSQCLHFLRDYSTFNYSVNPALDALVEYRCHFENIKYLTNSQQHDLIDVINSNISNTSYSLDGFVVATEVLKSKIDVGLVSKQVIDSQIKLLLGKKLLESADLTTFNILESLNEERKLGHDKMLELSYLSMIPKFKKQSDREEMVDYAFENFSINGNQKYFVAALKSVKPTDKTALVKYNLMMKGLQQ